MFGIWERLSQHLRELPGTLSGLFSKMLERLENDHGLEIVKFSLSFIEASRSGAFIARD